MKITTESHSTQAQKKNIKKAGEWYDKTDTMTDYFNTAFYIDLKLFPSKGISLALCNTL